jgi:hypothetical protein
MRHEKTQPKENTISPQSSRGLLVYRRPRLGLVPMHRDFPAATLIRPAARPAKVTAVYLPQQMTIAHSGNVRGIAAPSLRN